MLLDNRHSLCDLMNQGQQHYRHQREYRDDRQRDRSNIDGPRIGIAHELDQSPYDEQQHDDSSQVDRIEHGKHLSVGDYVLGDLGEEDTDYSSCSQKLNGVPVHFHPPGCSSSTLSKRKTTAGGSFVHVSGAYKPPSLAFLPVRTPAVGLEPIALQDKSYFFSQPVQPFARLPVADGLPTRSQGRGFLEYPC